MRSLTGVTLAALVVLYVAGAIHLFVSERGRGWRTEDSLADADGIRHPDVLLALLQSRLESNRFRDEELALTRKVLAEIPSFYQPPFLLATFHASRLDAPVKVRRAYEAALARYPANGRLRLAYGTWLLDARGSLDGFRLFDGEALRDPLPLAEDQLKAAMELEPELAWRALQALVRNRIPPSRWDDLVPDHPLARTHLLDAWFQAGELEAVWERLEGGGLPSDAATLRRVVYWGLEGKRADIALEAAERWKLLVEESRGAGPDVLDPALAIARAHLALEEPERAYDALVRSLQSLESKFGSSSRLSLQFLCAMGDEYLNRGHVVTAESLYAQAVSRSPSYVPARLGLARALRRSGDELGAIARYEDVLRLEPGNEPARRELAALLAAR